MTGHHTDQTVTCDCAGLDMNMAGHDRLITVVDRIRLQQLIARGSIVLLDAQAPGWFERERLPGAVRALPQDLPGLAERLPLGRQTEVVVYCWSVDCETSARTALQLMEMGYPHVSRYAAGKRDWIEAGLPVEGEETGALRSG
jgi:rhodanese-related sulfurtransferase